MEIGPEATQPYRQTAGRSLPQVSVGTIAEQPVRAVAEQRDQCRWGCLSTLQWHGQAAIGLGRRRVVGDGDVDDRTLASLCRPFQSAELGRYRDDSIGTANHHRSTGHADQQHAATGRERQRRTGMEVRRHGSRSALSHYFHRGHDWLHPVHCSLDTERLQTSIETMTALHGSTSSTRIFRFSLCSSE